MKKTALALIVISLIIVLVVAGIMLVDWKGTEEEAKLYDYPLEVENETYLVTVRTNWTSPPEVSYFGLLKSVDVNFRGTRGTVLTNITIPAELIWGELSVYLKDYKQSEDRYTLSSNTTHYSVQMKFQHIATVVIVSIRGTEGVTAQLITSSPSQEPIP